MRCSIGFAMHFVCHIMEILLVGSVPHSVIYFFVIKEEIWHRYHLSVTLCTVKWKSDRNYGITLIVTSQASCIPKQSKHKFVCCQSRSNCFDILFSYLKYILKSYVYVYVHACGPCHACALLRGTSLWIFCKANSYLFGSGLQNLSDLGFTFKQCYSFMAGIEMLVIHAVKS